MKYTRKILRVFAVFATIIVCAVSFHPAIDPFWDIVFSEEKDNYLFIGDSVTASEYVYLDYPTDNQTQLKDHVFELIKKTPYNHRTDTDEDGIYDVVERVIGTDYTNPDSDFDQLNDSFEIFHFLDPLLPDSNYDGLGDYFEVTNVSLDIDNDGILNQWDWDNDGDAVADSLDISPFSTSQVKEEYNFSVSTNGKPTYINYQIQPKEYEHLRLPAQSWDWPEDHEGLMKDYNGSDDDIFITPFLEMTFDADFIIRSASSNACIGTNQSPPMNTTLSTYAYQGTEHQHWELIETTGGYYKIISSATSLCIELQNASMSNHSKIVLGEYEGYEHQQWMIQLETNNTYTIISKHSEQCIEIENTSINATSSIFQHIPLDKNEQQWYLESVGDILPTQLDLLQYGSSLNLNKVSIPLSPVQDVGSPVAFQGKFFYNNSQPVQLTHNAKLLWMVNGKSDKIMRAMRTKSDQYITICNTSSYTISTNGNDLTDLSSFEFVDLGDMKYAIKAANGYYLSVINDTNNTISANKTDINDNEIFEMIAIGANTICFKAYNGMYISADNDGGFHLTANKNNIGAWEKFTLVDLEYEPEIVSLVHYYEDFKITGINIQENHGSHIQLFYSADLNQTLKAGIALSYEFLRSQQPLSDMTDVLVSDAVSVNTTNYSSFIHQDQGLAVIIGTYIPQVTDHLKNMTNDTTMPFITCIEDQFATVSINNLTHDLDDAIEISVSDGTITTVKSLKMSWYNTSSSTPVEVETLFDEMQQWGTQLGFNETDDAILTMIALAITWNVGESLVTEIGGIPTDFSLPETTDVISILTDYVWTSVTGLVDLTLAIKKGIERGYSFLKYTIDILKSITKSMKIQSGLGKLIKGIRAIQQVLNGAKASKFFSMLDRLGPWFLVIDLVITAGIAWYLWFSIAIDQGWTDFGVILAFIVFYAYVIYSLAIIGIGLIFPILALIFVILDLIFDFFGKFLEWIISIFTKTTPLSNVDLIFKGSPTLDTFDYDNNGLDEGDRIEFQTQVVAVVNNAHSINDLQNSYIIPSLTLSVPPGVLWNTTSTILDTETDDTTYRNTTYDLDVWVEPPRMVNFPMNIQLQYSYKIYYEECVWFFGWWCDRESKSETKTTDITTLYFDILPKDLYDFIDWKEIASIDVDGDGICNDKEIEYMANPWRYDTDGDGLWDGYEIEHDTLPYIADTDADGLTDGLEIRLKTDPNKMDTDNDGLSDYEEHRGWGISFVYFGNSMKRTIHSDPLKYDSDEDGLNDLQEYMRGLNPLSNDTNGDMILDNNEGIIPSYGFVTSIDFNDKGNSIRVLPNETIHTTVSYRFIGVNCSSNEPANLTLTAVVQWTNDSTNETDYYTICNETTQINTLVRNETSFAFNASASEGTYLIYYFVDWSCYGTMPPPPQRELLGIIEVNHTINSTTTWKCNAVGTDTDNDGIINIHESTGWSVTYTDSTGTYTIPVSSDPYMMDTDSDGLIDYFEHNCFENATNPRNPDTDGDGLTDSIEQLYGTNPLNYDTDGDGLDDQMERSFRSNPLETDTDNDGLSDQIEFTLLSNPNHNDTDHDGLNDSMEYLFQSSLLLPDTDADTLFDIDEYRLACNPNDNDTDDDGLIDGYEVLIGTNPTNNDTDDDGLFDYDETYWQTDPFIKDTDNDSALDGSEVYYGTHPKIPDSDFDGTHDFDDYDSYAAHVNHVVIASDVTDKTLAFEQHLSQYTNVTSVTAETFHSHKDYKTAPYIVLIGRPDAGNETIGNISKNILLSSGENISKILHSDDYRFFLTYGVWNTTQTVIILTTPYRSDHWIVLNLLKNMQKTITSNTTVTIDFPTPRKMFDTDLIDELGCYLRVSLDQSVIPSITLTRYNTSSCPQPLNSATGLRSSHKSMGIFLEINVSDSIQNDTRECVNESWILCYYTAKDLDRTGDGDGNDIGDIQEDRIFLYVYNETSMKWIQLIDTMDWVLETGVDTTNTKIYGQEYEGYVWARVTHFSLFSLAGNLRESSGTKRVVFPPNAVIESSETSCYVNTDIIFNASKSTSETTIQSYQWEFGDGQSATGELVTHQYLLQGTYTVELLVTDDAGLKDQATVLINVTQPNTPPTAPYIEGEKELQVNKSAVFSFTSIDIDNDTIRYHIDWGDTSQDTTSFETHNTTITMTHQWNHTGYYDIQVYATDENNASSQMTSFIVFIDVALLWVDDELTGCLIDMQGDGIYDVFYNNETASEIPLTQVSETQYTIDTDADGITDYQINILTGTLTTYEHKETEPESSSYMIIVFGFLILLLVALILVLKKSKKKNK